MDHDAIMAISELAIDINGMACEHGWWNEPRSFGDSIALMHSELSEALEEYRNGHLVDEIYFNDDNPGKPEGIPIELADTVIRIFDFCAQHDIDIAGAMALKFAYNATRPYRHGGKIL